MKIEAQQGSPNYNFTAPEMLRADVVVLSAFPGYGLTVVGATVVAVLSAYYIGRRFVGGDGLRLSGSCELGTQEDPQDRQQGSQPADTCFPTS